MEVVLNDIKNIVKEIGGSCYIVGGYIRNKLLNIKKDSTDIDIVYLGDLESFINKMKSINYKIIPLNKEKEIYRAFIGNKVVDISRLKGKDIESDLKNRDFTINAIALKLIDNKIIDHLRGRDHLKAKLIHPCENSINSDPIRILRGYRFSIKYGLHFSSQCEEDILKNKNNIMKCPKERIFNEVMQIINVDKHGIAFQELDVLGVLNELLPYIDELKTIGKCNYHIEDVFTHMNLVYKNCKQIIDGRLQLEGLDLSIFKEKIGEVYIGDYFSFAGFCHDIGKFICYTKVDHKVSFIGHDKEGAKISQDICNKLGFPNKAKTMIKTLIEAHMYSLGLFKNNMKSYKKSFYKFFHRYDKYIPLIVAMSYCDMYATKMLYDPDNEYEDMKEFLEKIYKEYLIYKDILNLKVVDGNMVREITGAEGRQINDILECVRKKIYYGEMKTKEEIVQWIQQYKKSI